MTDQTLVSVQDLNVRFRSSSGEFTAVNGVSFDIRKGEVLGLIGESGSGKSVTLRAMMRLLPEQRSSLKGAIQVGGEDVLAMDARALRRYRGGTAAMVFQDPALALDPVYTVGQQIEEAVMWHRQCSRKLARARALALLEMVKVPSPQSRLDNYPHEMSGGMRQRAMIALALSCDPQLILADEPTTALDATVQIQVLLIIRELQKKMGLGAIFVTHDLGVAAEICDRIAVMYAGRIVEIGSAQQLLSHPQHPYTQSLLRSTVHGAMRGTRIAGIPGAPPDIRSLPDGCAFQARCSQSIPSCCSRRPDLAQTGPGHLSACLLTQQNHAHL